MRSWRGGAGEGMGGEDRRGGRPKISRFFFLLPLPFSFFSLSPGLLVEILVVFWSVGTLNVLVFALGLPCGSPRTPNVHISGSRCINHTTKIQRNDPKRGRKNENGSGRRKKKREIWAESEAGGSLAKIGQLKGYSQSLFGCGQSRRGQSRSKAGRGQSRLLA